MGWHSQGREKQGIRTLLHQMGQRKAHGREKSWWQRFREMIIDLMATVGKCWHNMRWNEYVAPMTSIMLRKTSGTAFRHDSLERPDGVLAVDGGRQAKNGLSANIRQPERHQQPEGEGSMNSIMNNMFRWGIATKLVVMFAVFGIVPMAAVGYLGSSATGEMEKAAGQRVQAVAENVADKIDRNLSERYGDAQIFGLNKIVGERYHWYSKENNAIASAMNQYVAASGIYSLTILVDPVGDVMAVNSKDAKGNPLDTTALYSKKYADASWFKALQAK